MAMYNETWMVVYCICIYIKKHAFHGKRTLCRCKISSTHEEEVGNVQTFPCETLFTMKFILPLALLATVSAQSNHPRTSDSTSHSGPSDNPIFKKGQYTIHPQNATSCHTHGEKQWAGTVDISNDRRLFYWYFDSRSDPENDPIVIFLNG